jgi:hypothetical protein
VVFCLSPLSTPLSCAIHTYTAAVDVACQQQYTQCV